MHHMLEIPEILLNIFGHCHLPSTGPGTAGSDLPALARTCHAFKEPALDLLWKNLPDPSPVARCLPEASSESKNKYFSFYRTITQSEWDILRSYTCRIQSLTDDGGDSGGERDRLDWNSVRIFLNPPIAQPLFPNLLHLHVVSRGRSTRVKHLLCMPFPALTSLTIDTMNEKHLSVFQHPIELFSRFSPDIRKLSFTSESNTTMFSNFFTSRIFRWQKLQAVSCIEVALDADALAHLSHMPALTELTCTVSAGLADQVTPFYFPLLFSNVRVLRFYSDHLESISRLLSRTRLPVVRIFAAIIGSCKMDFSSFLSALDTSGIADIVEEFRMKQVGFEGDVHKPILALKDLRPLMALTKLRHFNINVQCEVYLSNSDLLTVTSAWPRLEVLHIYREYCWVWQMRVGITPDGLLQLLQQCPSLHHMSLAIDTQNFTEAPSLESIQALTLPPELTINILDPPPEEESVQAITTFFARIARHTSLSLCTDETWGAGHLWTGIRKQLARKDTGSP